MNFSDPVIILGAHGGGTSYITKLLRMQSFNAGLDCCPIKDRKTHECRGLNRINKRIIDLMGISGQHSSGRTNEVIAEYRAYYQSPHRTTIEQTVDSIMQSVNWCEFFGKDYQISAWGWKDPRNSITLEHWLRLFPKAKVLIISKSQKAGPANSASGNWFKNQALGDTIKFYVNPPGLRATRNHFTIKFERTVDDCAYFVRICKFIGLPPPGSERAYRQLLEASSLERDHKLNSSLTN